MKDLSVALVLRFEDRVIGPLRRALGEAASELRGVTRESTQASSATDRLGTSLTAVGRAADLSKPVDGVRRIATEAERARERMGKLKDVMGALPNVGRGIATAFGAVAAARAVVATPMERARQYELSLANLANVAYNDRKAVAGRREGMREMDVSIREASREGVTREQALSGFNTLISSGMGVDDAKAAMKPIAQTAVAAGADINDIANIYFKAMKTYGMSGAEAAKALELALVAGQEGGFELRDMAKWLPQQMAISRGMLGMKGTASYVELLAANEMAVNTAGTTPEAGNNLVNLLQKINSQDTANDAKKLGIDLAGSLAAAREKGTSPMEAFLNLVERETAKDKRYAALQKRGDAAKKSGDKGEQKATLEAMADITAGSAIGKLIQDRQALLALLAINNNRSEFKDLQTRIKGREGEAQLSHDTVASTAAAKYQLGENAELERQFDALSGLNSVLGDTKVQLAKLSADYPAAAAGLEGLKIAAYAASAALGAVALGSLAKGLMGGGVAIAGIKTLLGGGAAAASGAAAAGQVGLYAAGGAAPAAAAAAGGTLAATLATGAAGILAAGGAGYAVGTGVNALMNRSESGRETGAAIGEMVARVAAFFGSEEAKAAIASDQQARAAAQLERAAQALKNPPSVTVVLDGREIASAIDDRQRGTMNRE